jgi:hypothetical protein
MLSTQLKVCVNEIVNVNESEVVHPIPGPFYNTGISVLKKVNTGNTGIIPVLKV